jgi:Family of unknown function (DUF5670)
LVHGIGAALAVVEVYAAARVDGTPNRTAPRSDQPKKGGIAMLWTLAVVLLVLWALGLVSSYTLGGFIHILLVAAIIVVLINLISGRRAV